MGGVVKKIRKIIPKEVRPAVPFVAAYYGGPALGKALGIKSAAASKALTAALASKAQGDDTDIALRSAALAATPDLIQSGLGKIGTKLTPQTAGALKASLPELPVTVGGELVAAANQTVPLSQQLGSLATAASESDLMTSLVSPKGQTLGAQAKALAIPTAIEGSAQLAQIQQDELDRYNRELQEQGIINKVKRRQSIYDIYINAGYEPDYVNSVLDKYGYAEGGIIEQFEKLRAKMKAPESIAKAMSKKNRFRTQKDKKNKKTFVSEPDEKGEITINIEGSEGDDGFLQSLQTAREGIEMAYKPPVGSVQAVPMMKFAEGGEVEESSVMMASVPGPFDDYDDIAMQLFGKGYKDLTPEEMELMQEELERLMNKFRGATGGVASKEGIMQMASGYKSDIEEMYEQYVFEMEEQGLVPMSFAEFLRQARSGMANGGKAQRRKKGEPADEVIEEDEEEIFIDNMPRPKRQGIMEAADGGIMEKDMRGGGFIPEGSKERADDVPARLSKNEFVMTADAVRAAGGGSINKGAKRMYDMMYSLEGKV